MSIFELTAVLNHHKITNMVKDGHVLVLMNEHWIDVTNWSRKQVASWLGY